MRFWDASAILPLLVSERTTPAIRHLLAQDGVMLVWWATPVECASAVSRLEREGGLSASGTRAALQRLDGLGSAWSEVQPLEGVRRTARRLLRVHPLRAADALQLGAALIGSEGQPHTLPLVSLDARLVEAAAREGFPIVETDSDPAS